MLSRLIEPFKKLLYHGLEVRSFIITRLREEEITQQVILISDHRQIDISTRHAMICLDPFSVGIWLPHPAVPNSTNVTIHFINKKKKRAKLQLELIEKTAYENDVLLLYKAVSARCYQLNSFTRFMTLYFFLRNISSTYRQRKFIAALYSYPRKIISVSYKEEDYVNIFPMDIQGYVRDSGLYILGLRTTNYTLEKILTTKKLVVGDTHSADLKTIYSLGRHLSK